MDVPQRADSFYGMRSPLLLSSLLQHSTPFDRFLAAQLGPFTKPFWLVLQAFGAQSHWSRWPTPAEERFMTYSALIKGAMGVLFQSFLGDC